MSTQRPNILFLLSDEHSYRCFSYLDPNGEGEPVRTPTLDGLATNGVNFRQTYCQMPLCTPSRMCFLTSREQRRAGAWDNESWLKPGIPTLPEVFSDAGWETCLVGKAHFGGDRQFNGYQHRPYGDLTGAAGHQSEYAKKRNGDTENGMRLRTLDAGITEIPESRLQEHIIVRESITWLREHEHAQAGKPWFLCASFSRPHFPLTAPRRFFERYWPNGVTPPKTGPGDTHDHPMTQGMRTGFQTDEIGNAEAMRARAAYFACVDYLDEILRDFLTLLDADGFLDNTIIVYTTDHGELAGEHGLWWKNSWHEAATRVPWFIQTPEHRSGAIASCDVNTPVSLADLFPTLAGLCGVESPVDIDGIDLSDTLTNGAEPTRRPVYTDALTPRWGIGTEFRMVRDGKWKYVAFRNAPPILINLESDPYEQHNLAGAADASVEVKEAVQRLAKIVAESIDFDAAEAERLRDEKLTIEHALRIKRGYRNMYLLADGRLIDADREIYEPPVLSDDPETAFADFPRGNRSG